MGILLDRHLLGTVAVEADALEQTGTEGGLCGGRLHQQAREQTVGPAPQQPTMESLAGPCFRRKRAHLGALLDISDGVVEVVQADVELCEAGRAAGEWGLISDGRRRKEQ